MPPKKEQLSKDGADLARLVEKYDIHFKGPVPPEEWPKHLQFEGVLRHRFSVFREIWGNRYERLKRKRGFENVRPGNMKERADELRRRALKLRDNLNPNESTWRANIEQVVFDRFQKDVICREHCGGEIHESKYEAEPLTTDARNQLQQRRLERVQCNIRHRAVEFSSMDRERDAIFNDENEHEIEHESDEDELRSKSGLPMKPDKVIGLTSRHQADMLWNPVKGVRMTCPFLVVEAKKESTTPGFRSIERQTAFPIRRLLRLQAHVLGSRKVAHEPPLVWFFAYQGEEWRLYAGTLERRRRSRSSGTAGADGGRLEEPQVCVYDLWHGTVESQDGALQLLQIVDHIWTWARDIYRPGIRTCLQDLNNRDSSPASTVQFYGTPSVYSDSTSLSNIRRQNSAPSGQLQNTFRPDQTASAYISEHVSLSRQPLELHSTQNPSAEDSKIVRNVSDVINDDQNEQIEARPGMMSHRQNPRDNARRASIPAHPILRWADLHLESAEFSSFATVCHANIARFTFCIRDITDFEVYLSNAGSEYTRRERWQLMDIYRISIQISRTTLSRFESYWTQRGLAETTSSPDEIVRATIFFHTYLHHMNWQIVREIVCVIWPSEIVSEDGDLLHISSFVQPADVVSCATLIREFQPLKQLNGGQSVLCAHNDYTFLPFFEQFGHCGVPDNQHIIWKTPGGVFPSGIQLKACIKLLRDDALFAFPTNGLCAADTEPITLSSTETQIDVSGILPGLPDSMAQASSLIAIKPTSWPMRTAKFCLFVMQEVGFDTAKALKQLLEDAVRNENMIGHRSEFLLTKNEQAGINRWAEWLLIVNEDSGMSTVINNF
ncbi:hypothetical protein BDV96DRAFT_585029 [Lophiotrema nucula]|uniref:Uncharacterized protein n=1 Tax=Lophiotrema nucula TaxID=690887 RepID=A0A6A5YQT3_9PLEO|nr:hypothetical protein BDV96DRAFT_585029 [Lophiotrema nucula]